VTGGSPWSVGHVATTWWPQVRSRAFISQELIVDVAGAARGEPKRGRDRAAPRGHRAAACRRHLAAAERPLEGRATKASASSPAARDACYDHTNHDAAHHAA